MRVTLDCVGGLDYPKYLEGNREYHDAVVAIARRTLRLRPDDEVVINGII